MLVEAGVQRQPPVALLSVSGQGNQIDIGVAFTLSDPPRELQAVDLRQPNVDDRHDWRHLVDQSKSCGAVVGRLAIEASVRQQRAQDISAVWIILDNDDLRASRQLYGDGA